MSLIQRYRDHQLDKTLAALQILAFLATIAFVVAAVMIYRHFTDDALTPPLDYLLSLKLAFPPALALGATYLYAFLTGESVSEAPKSMWRHVKNSTLQSRRQLQAYSLAITVTCAVTATALHFHIPPAYERLVAQLLGGSNDDYQIIKDTIAKLKQSSPALSDRLTIVAKVFDERRLLNSENKTPSTFLPRVLIRQLQPDPDEGSWKNHPLRHFALAEAHSMLAQALANLQSGSAKATIESTRDSAIAEYKVVLADNSNRTTPLMRKSAMQNIGNVYLYSGNCKKAGEIYSQLSENQTNAGTEGNRVAALVVCGRVTEAITVGSKAIANLQGKPQVLNSMRDFVNLLTNTGFAKMINRSYVEAQEDMQAAHDLIPDAMAKQNLALALIGTSKVREAIAALESDVEAPSVSPENQLQITTRNNSGSCSYVIRALALSSAGEDEATIVANVLAYARRPEPADLIVKSGKNWKTIASDVLKADKRPCGNLIYLPFVSGLLK